MATDLGFSPSPRDAAGAARPGAASGNLMLMFGLPVAIVGLWVALLPAVLVVLALKLNRISPSPEAAAGNLGLILGVGALFAMFANPLAGRLSDRTFGRFGMRRPWIIGGVVVGYGALLMLALTDSIAMLVVGWAIAQVGFNAAFAGLMAIMPDQVAPNKRGRVAAAIGIGNNLAVPVATFIVQLFTVDTVQIIVPATIGVAVVLVFAFSFKDRVLESKPVEKLNLVSLLGSFVFNPIKNPDLGWAWLTKFLMVVAQATALTYLTLFLTKELGMSAQEAASGVFYASTANFLGLMCTTLAAGWLSDKLNRRKIFVLFAGVIGVAGLITIALAPNFAAVVLGQFIMGAGMGAFFAVDLALISDVLPSEKNNAKDLGVVNIAQALPQSLVPAAAPTIIGLTGGFAGLFLTGAVAGLLGAVAVTRVKGVR